MLSLLKGSVGETAAPLIFLVLFLVIVGGALWVTPRLAKWLDQREAKNKSYFDGMLEEDPAETADTSVQKGGDSHV
ncbi:MAG: hypothetical protein HFF76_03635 [Oscillospiraceae bacterium]|jgi:hypothetical protein|nr:hypothetical protein [Oscillospiraceae bacterium]